MHDDDGGGDDDSNGHLFSGMAAVACSWDVDIPSSTVAVVFPYSSVRIHTPAPSGGSSVVAFVARFLSAPFGASASVALLLWAP